jgi:hypothetical protein
LHGRGLINPFSGQSFQGFSVNELIDLTKRTVHGPRSWSTRDSPPAVAHQIVLHPSIPSEDIVDRDRAVLLFGGRFVLFSYSGILKCWSVLEDRLIWEYKGQGSSFVKEFSTQLVDEGQAVMIVIGVWVMQTACVLPFLTPRHVLN